MYQRAYTWSEDQDVRSCSYCDRPTIRESEVAFRDGPTIYSCSTCGQREAVSWQSIPSVASHTFPTRCGETFRVPSRCRAGYPAVLGVIRWVQEVEVVEEPHIILGED